MYNSSNYHEPFILGPFFGVGIVVPLEALKSWLIERNRDPISIRGQIAGEYVLALGHDEGASKIPLTRGTLISNQDRAVGVVARRRRG